MDQLPPPISEKPFLLRHKWWFIGSFLFFFFVIIPMFLMLGLIGALAGLSEEQSKTEIISGTGRDRIALINIDGVIVEQSGSDGFSAFGQDMTSAGRVKKELQLIEKDSNVKALLIRINSPGGSAAASEEILNEIKSYKQRTNHKVVSYFSDMAASGGYYVAMSSDKIVANPSTLTGSIGVIISYLNFEDLANKYGVKNIVYKSGPNKDIISEFRSPTEEEKVIMQSLIDDVYGNFVGAVMDGRNLSEDRVKTLADGRIYSANQALSENLVDSIGTFEDAVSVARNEAGLKEATVVEYGIPGFWDFLAGSISGKLNLNVVPDFESLIGSKLSPRVLYLYAP